MPIAIDINLFISNNENCPCQANSPVELNTHKLATVFSPLAKRIYQQQVKTPLQGLNRKSMPIAIGLGTAKKTRQPDRREQ